MAAKRIAFDQEAREAILRGVKKLARATGFESERDCFVAS